MTKHKVLHQQRHLSSHSARLLLLLSLAILIFAVIWYILYNSTPTPLKQATPPGTSKLPSIKTTGPYQGWKTYTIPKSYLSFRYPPDWQLNPATGPLGPWASPGTPETSLTAPNGLYIDILTDRDTHASEADNFVLHAAPIRTLGQTYYIDYIDAVGDRAVTYAALLIGPNASSAYPSVMMPTGTTDRLIISIAYQVKSGPAEKPLNFYLQDPTMRQAALLVASLQN